MNNNTYKYFNRFIQLALNYDFKEDEIVKEIKAHNANERYFISNYGDAFSLCYNHWYKMHPSPDNRGYLEITIRDDGQKQHCRIHQLVAEAFLADTKPIGDVEVHHLDGNKQNNYYKNLIYCTKEEHRLLHQQLRNNK